MTRSIAYRGQSGLHYSLDLAVYHYESGFHHNWKSVPPYKPINQASEIGIGYINGQCVFATSGKANLFASESEIRQYTGQATSQGTGAQS
jgi:hypothetical protein